MLALCVLKWACEYQRATPKKARRMTITLYQDTVLIAAVAAVSAAAGFMFGYIYGRKTGKNPVRFAIRFTTLQIVAVVLFVVYNRLLTDDPDQLVNLGILAMIGGESLGMLFTRGVDKAIEKVAENDKKSPKS